MADVMIAKGRAQRAIGCTCPAIFDPRVFVRSADPLRRELTAHPIALCHEDNRRTPSCRPERRGHASETAPNDQYVGPQVQGHSS